MKVRKRVKRKWILLVFAIVSMTQAFAQITWSPAVTISASTMDNSSNPNVVVDTNGNSTAVWIENGFVYASFLPNGGTWESPVTISGSGASMPQIGCDGNGTVTAAWVSSNGTIQYATLPLNGSWSSATSVSSSGATTPSLAVNSSGTIALVWQRNGYIESVTKTLLGLLTLVSTISPVNSANPDVAIGDDGTVVAVWQTILSSGAATVESARQTSGIWSASVDILPAPSAFSMNYPKVSVDSSGNADVIWYRYQEVDNGFSNVFVYTATLPVGSESWSFPLQISDIGLGDPANLFNNIVTDGSGNKMATWTISYDGQSYQIESAIKESGKTWTDFSFVENIDVYALRGGLACDTLGNCVAVNMLTDVSGIDIQAAEASTSIIGGVPIWSSRVTISSEINNGYPVVASSFDSTADLTNVTAVWLASNGTNTIVQAATGSKTPIDPPSNLMVTQSYADFGVFQDYANTITWTASSSPNVVLYSIYRNGVLISEVSSSVSEFVDHHVEQNGSVTYGVAALDFDLFQSVIVNVNYP